MAEELSFVIVFIDEVARYKKYDETGCPQNGSYADIFEEEYEKLVRNIYNKPLYRKPKLGKQPEWLDEEKSDLFPLTDLIRQIKGATSDKKEA